MLKEIGERVSKQIQTMLDKAEQDAVFYAGALEGIKTLVAEYEKVKGEEASGRAETQDSVNQVTHETQAAKPKGKGSRRKGT